LGETAIRPRLRRPKSAQRTDSRDKVGIPPLGRIRAGTPCAGSTGAGPRV